MSNFTYYLDYGDGTHRILSFPEELTTEQQAEFGYIPYRQAPLPAGYNPEKQEIDRYEIQIIDNEAVSVPLVRPKTPQEVRRYMNPVYSEDLIPAEGLATVGALLERIINHLNAQADPGQPQTIFQITGQEMTAVQQLRDLTVARPLPNGAGRLPPVRKQSEV